MKSVFLLFLALLIAFVACKDFPAVAPVTNTKASFFYYLESCENGQVGVVFDASASQELLRYDWDFGDGSRLDTTAAVVRHVYKNAAPETFLVVLQAKYDEMNVDSLTKTIIIDPNATLKWTKTGDQLGLSPFFGRTNWVGETPDGGVAATGFVKVDANSWTPMQMFVVKLDALGKLVFSILLSISGTSQSEGVAAIAEKDGSIIACGKALDTDSQWHLAVWNINNIGVVVSSYLVPTADEVAVDDKKVLPRHGKQPRPFFPVVELAAGVGFRRHTADGLRVRIENRFG